MLNAEEYGARLQTYSKSTIQMIMDMLITKELSKKVHKITTDPTLTENQVVEKLKVIAKEEGITLTEAK